MVTIGKEIQKKVAVTSTADTNGFSFNATATVTDGKLSDLDSVQILKNGEAIGNVYGSMSMPSISAPLNELSGAVTAYMTFVSEVKAKVEEGGEA